MKRLYSNYHEMIDYLIVGILTTIVNFSVFFFFDSVVDISYLIANALSILVAIVFSFYLNKKYVFKSKSANIQAWFREFALFAGFRLGSGLYDMVSMWVLVDFFYMDTNLAKVLTEIVVVIVNYCFSKFIVFRKRKK